MICHFQLIGKNSNQFLRNAWEEGSCSYALLTAQDGFNLPTNLAIDLFEGRKKFTGNTKDVGVLFLEDDNYEGKTADYFYNLYKSKYFETQMAIINYHSSLLKRSFSISSSYDKFSIEKDIRNDLIGMEKLKFQYFKELEALYKITNHFISDIEKATFDILNKLNIEKEERENEEIIKINEMMKSESLKYSSIANGEIITASPKEASSGWLNPDGIFYICNYAGHIKLASLMNSEERELEQKGWVKFSAYSIYTNYKLTNRQKDFIYDFAVEHKFNAINIDYHNVNVKALYTYFDENYS